MDLYNETEFLAVCNDLGIELVDRTSEEGCLALEKLSMTSDEIRELFLCQNQTSKA